jgi:hypothetical protein
MVHTYTMRRAKRYRYYVCYSVFRRALTLAEARLGPAHPTYGQILVNYTVFLRSAKSRAKKLEAQGRAMLEEFARRNGANLTVDASVFRRLSR